jgi:hypothetical protein
MSRSGRGGEEKNSELLPGLEPPIIQPLAQRYTTELSRLLECLTEKGRGKVKVKLSLCSSTKHHVMKAYWEWRYCSTYSLISALDGVSG